MKVQTDWLPLTRPEQSLMFKNIKDKISGYQIILNLSDGQLERIKLICDIFTEVNSFVEQSYMTARNITDWENLILNGSPRGSIPPAAPIFQPKEMPKGAFIGIVEEFGEIIKLIKSARYYSQKIGLDLMIIGNNLETKPNKIFPILRVQTFYGKKVSIEGNLQGMHAMRIEYKNDNAFDWKTVAFLTKLPAEFTIKSDANEPKTGQIRGILINDNDEVGQFSLNYPVILS